MEKQEYFPRWNKSNKSNSPVVRNINEQDAKSGSIFDQSVKPSLYKIWLINDDRISSEVFVTILKENFRMKNDQESLSQFIKLRNEGYLSHGSYTKEVAEEKISKIYDMGRASGCHIKCLMCKDDYAIRKS